MSDAIRADFDRIAALPDCAWSHNSHYHRFLLRQLPPEVHKALDAGCGTGELSRLLATRARSVLALDLSPEMIRVAKERSGSCATIEYRVEDVTATALAPASLDCIACVATLHHLPLADTLARFAAALAPGGTLLVLDLYQAAGPADFAAEAVALPVNVLVGLLRNGRLRADTRTREAWARHGAHDSYPTLTEVRAACAVGLPGATRVRRHLYWRYSLVWRKPAQR